MPKAETWYDSQANIAKLITYAALLILFATLVWGVEVAINVFRAGASDYAQAIAIALAGIAVSAFLAGMSAIIDLLIVNAEALRSK